MSEPANEPFSPGLADFVAALPKAELHLHLVGSASLQTVADLARRRPDAGVPTDVAGLRDFYEFRDFGHFIEVYLTVQSLVRDAEDVRTLVVGLARDLAEQNVRYAEVSVTAYNHVLDGMPYDTLANGLTEGRQQAEAEHGVRLAWCFDIDGGKGAKAGRETAEFAVTSPPDGLVSFGLAGPEVGVDRSVYLPAFDRARAAGLRSVPHAGETTGPATVWHAVRELAAERIGHGTSSAGDPALLEHLREYGIALEVCPTSNVRTRQIESIEAHPVRRMLGAGVPVTLNTDDPPMFGATLNGEYLAVATAFGLDRARLAALAGTAVRASFLDEDGKAALLAEIESVAADPRWHSE